MKLEAIRILADELDDATYGVNALIPDVPLDGDDTAPPDLVSIYDASRTGWVTRGELPEELRTADECPFLVVTAPGDIDLGGRSRPTDDATGVVRADLMLTVQYVTHDSLSEQGQQDALYTMRAVRSVIQRLAGQSRASARLRNKVQLEVLKSIHELDGFDPIDDKVSIAGIVATTWTARETSL